MPEPTADRPAAFVLPYGRPARGSAVWRWVRPGSAGFFGIVLILAALATWGGWRWRLRADEKAFKAVTWRVQLGGLPGITFNAPPTRAALRHLCRRYNCVWLTLAWKGAVEPKAWEVFRSVPLPDVQGLTIVSSSAGADALLREIARPDSGLRTIAYLDIERTRVTDAGLLELARPDSGLRTLTTLWVPDAQLTSTGVKALRQARPGLDIRHFP